MALDALPSSASYRIGNSADTRIRSSYADAEPLPFWLDRPERPAPRSSLTHNTDADLVVVGGGFTGLWTAVLAKQAQPGRDVLLLEADRIGHAASGRNGGFCDASLTHGLANGMARFAGELGTLERLGADNLDGIEATVRDFGIACDFERTGAWSVATADWQDRALRELLAQAKEHGIGLEYRDGEQVRAAVASPTYRGAIVDPKGVAMLDPARLAWVAQELGVRVHERTAAVRLHSDRAGVIVELPGARVRARHVALASNAFPSLLRRVDHYLAPVWDYVLMTEPLNAEQRSSIGWADRQGMSDAGNQFHYYRLSADNRILWGGYDAMYLAGGARQRVGGSAGRAEHHDPTYHVLAEHFFDTFPQLEGLRFSHRWGGMIDTCSRFSPFWGTAHGGRVAYVAGYTGLGVGSSRFGARVMLDLLEGKTTKRTSLAMVGSKPLPFPPEPARYAAITLTRRAIAKADRNAGRRGPWLRTLDRLGLGFDS